VFTSDYTQPMSMLIFFEAALAEEWVLIIRPPYRPPGEIFEGISIRGERRMDMCVIQIVVPVDKVEEKQSQFFVKSEHSSCRDAAIGKRQRSLFERLCAFLSQGLSLVGEKPPSLPDSGLPSGHCKYICGFSSSSDCETFVCPEVALLPRLGSLPVLCPACAPIDCDMTAVVACEGRFANTPLTD
jgi:hypothetical protein